MRTHHGRVHYPKSTSQTGKSEERKIFSEKEKIHHTWGQHHGTETDKTGHEKEEKEAYWGTTCIWKNEFSDSDQESFNCSSSKQDKISKLGSGELFNFNNYHSSKNLKQHKESFLNLNYCINANYNYKSLRSCLVSQPNSNKNNKKIVSSMQEDLVPITFG